MNTSYDEQNKMKRQNSYNEPNLKMIQVQNF